MPEEDAFPTGLAAALLLGDGRLPTGGYAHSTGLESAARRGWVRTPQDLTRFVRGRAATTGLMNASFAAAAHRAAAAGDPGRLQELDELLLARTPSPALRAVGVQLGRTLLRAMQGIVPGPALEALPAGLQQPIVFGVVARHLGLSVRATAAAHLHETVTGPAIAAVKVLHVDPFTAHRAVAEVLPLLDRLAAQAAERAEGPLAQLPALSSPLSDLAAEMHEEDDARLFVS